MRHSQSILLATLLCSTAACGSDARCATGTEAVGGQCRAIAQDAGQDTNKDPIKGLDGSTPSSAEIDAGRDAADGAQRDDAALDGGEPSDACVAKREVCNGLDDDCDGDVDNGVLKFYYVDKDGDGYGGAQGILACSPPSEDYTEQGNDCDDECKTCNAGNTEESICDGKDDDCDGMLDEGVKGTYYPDADGDGVGASGPSVVACSAPPHHVKDSSSDCDDTCATCNPSQEKDETCDGKDDDCSGTVDEDATFTPYYKDCDEDGYALSSTDPKDTVVACARPAAVGDCGWATRKPISMTTTDCNDANASVKPGQTEFKRDKIPAAIASKDFDYNCDGREEKEPLLNECSPSCREGCYVHDWPNNMAPDVACGVRYAIVQSENSRCTEFRVNALFSTYPQNCR